MNIKELPPRISQYIASYYASLKNLKLASRFRLTGDQLDEFVLLVGRAFLKEFELKDLPNELQKIGVPQGQAFLLAADTAEQHFASYEDYLGSTREQVDLWRAWGREFGGKEPEEKAAPDIEAMIGRAGTRRTAGGRVDIAATGAKPTQAQQQRAVQSTVAPVKQPLPARAAEAPVRAAPERPGMSREQFLDQVRQFTIDKLRPGGQPAVQRLQQVRSSLEQVVSGNAADQPAVADALRASPLFRLYQEMGQESLRGQKPIDHVIYERYTAQRPYLLREEFDAVAQLASMATPASQPQTVTTN